MKAAVFGLTAVVTLATLTACERPEAPPAAVQAGVSSGAMAAIPLGYADALPGVETTLTLPAAIRAHPGLHRLLYDREVEALKTFAADARDTRGELGDGDAPPFEMQVTWRVAAETPRLLSLVREGYEYAGGAHPTTALSTLLFDKRTGREIEGEALVSAPELARLDTVLCDAVKAAKAERGGVEIDGDTFACPKWKDAQLALAATDGKVSGVRAMISPYEVGPYAEGSYEVDVPAAAFRSALATEYRGEFAG